MPPSLLLPLTSAQTCYFPNGSPLPSSDWFYSSMQPCNLPGLSTICCATNRTNPSGADMALGNTRDECIPNGLCQNRKLRDGAEWTTFHANFCTSPNFTSPSCLSICAQTRGTGGGTRVTPCTGKADSEKWCCGDTSACCESGVGVVEIARVFGGKVEEVRRSSSVSSVAERSRSSLSAFSSNTTNTPASSGGVQGQKNEEEGEMGGGVIAGTVVGALAGLAVLAAVVLFALQRRKSRRLDFAEDSVAPPQYRQHEYMRYEKDVDGQIAEMEQPRSELAGIGRVDENGDNEGRHELRAHQAGVVELSGSDVR